MDYPVKQMDWLVIVPKPKSYIQEVSSLIFCRTSLPLDTVTQPNFLHEELILLARDQVGF